MGHLVDADRHRQDHNIILARFNFHTVAISYAEPLLGNLGDLVRALTDAVLVVQDIAFYLQVGSVLDLDRKTVAHR